MTGDGSSQLKAFIRQLHSEPFDIPPPVRDHLERNAVAASLLASPAYEPTVVWSRMQGSPNGLLFSTLQGDATIPYWINLRSKQRRTLTSQPETERTEPDLISLVQLGGKDVCSHSNILHGGIVSTLFDEVALATISHCLDTHPADFDNPMIVHTVQLDVKFLKSVKVPGLVIIRSWCTAMSGRKCWVWAELLQEPSALTSKSDEGTKTVDDDPMKKMHVMATCESLWLQSPKAKM